MAKKKNFQKKHNFKHTSAPAAAPVQSDNAEVAEVPKAAPKLASVRPAATMTAERDFGYVTRDLRRIGLAAVVLVALELGLFFLLTKTPAGDAIYNLVKV